MFENPWQIPSQFIQLPVSDFQALPTTQSDSNPHSAELGLELGRFSVFGNQGDAAVLDNSGLDRSFGINWEGDLNFSDGNHFDYLFDRFFFRGAGEFK